MIILPIIGYFFGAPAYSYKGTKFIDADLLPESQKSELMRWLRGATVPVFNFKCCPVYLTDWVRFNHGFIYDD